MQQQRGWIAVGMGYQVTSAFCDQSQSFAPIYLMEKSQLLMLGRNCKLSCY